MSLLLQAAQTAAERAGKEVARLRAELAEVQRAVEAGDPTAATAAAAAQVGLEDAWTDSSDADLERMGFRDVLCDRFPCGSERSYMCSSACVCCWAQAAAGEWRITLICYGFTC